METEYKKIKVGRLKGVVKSSIWSPEFEKVVCSFPDLFSANGKRSEELREVTIATLQFKIYEANLLLSVKYTKPMYFCIKFNLGKLIRNIIKPSKAEYSWRIGQSLLEHNLPVPEPIAYLDQRIFGFLHKCYYFSTYIKNASLASDLLLRESDRTFNRLLLTHLGSLVGSLHANGFRHGDMGSGNFLVKREKDSLNIFIIDIETITHHRYLPLSATAYDIASMLVSFKKNITRNDLLCFFKNYFKSNHKLRENRKIFFKKVREDILLLLDNKMAKQDFKNKILKQIEGGCDLLFICKREKPIMVEIISNLKKDFPKSNFHIYAFEEQKFFSLMKKIQAKKRRHSIPAYDIIIDWTGSMVSSMLSYCLGAKLRVGYRTRNYIKNKFFYNMLIKPYSWSIDERDGLLAPLREIGVDMQ